MMIHAFGLGSTGCWNFTQVCDLSWRPLSLGSLLLLDVLLNFCLAWSNFSLDSVWEVTFMYVKLSCSVGREVKVMEVVSIDILFWLLDPTSIQLLYLLGGVRIRDYRIMDVFLKAVVSQVANGKTWKTSKLFQIGVIFPSSTSTHKPFVKNRAIFENLGSSHHCVGPVRFQIAWGNKCHLTSHEKVIRGKNPENGSTLQVWWSLMSFTSFTQLDSTLIQDISLSLGPGRPKCWRIRSRRLQRWPPPAAHAVGWPMVGWSTQNQRLEIGPLEEVYIFL